MTLQATVASVQAHRPKQRFVLILTFTPEIPRHQASFSMID